MTRAWPGEAGEVQAQARFVRSSQTGLEARPGAALHGGAKSVAGSAPLCLCKDPALRGTGCGAGVPAWSPDTGTVPDAGHILSAVQAVSCHTALAVHLCDPEPLEQPGTALGSLSARPGTG